MPCNCSIELSEDAFFTRESFALDGDTADILVPLAFVLWQSTPDAPTETEPYTIGVEVTSGRNAGKHRVSLSPEGLTVEDLQDWYWDMETIHPFLDGNGRVGGVIVAGFAHARHPEKGWLAPNQ